MSIEHSRNSVFTGMFLFDCSLNIDKAKHSSFCVFKCFCTLSFKTSHLARFWRHGNKSFLEVFEHTQWVQIRFRYILHNILQSTMWIIIWLFSLFTTLFCANRGSRHLLKMTILKVLSIFYEWVLSHKFKLMFQQWSGLVVIVFPLSEKFPRSQVYVLRSHMNDFNT
jgi:hypothetical protein